MESVDDYEYHTSDLIGHGAFAVVFKGRNKRNVDQVVAIKNIHKKNLSKSQTFPEKEIEILKELNHENVVALLHFKESPTSLYMVMEFCNGGDLADYLHVKGTLSEGTICHFLKQIAAAMKTLHAKGIIHRDLKPQNLLLSYKGRVKPPPPPSEIVIKIADFGFARFLEEDMMAATICGSPLYMAPEVITSQQYTAKADLWSVGTIIYQCLTGSAPFKASNPKELKMFYEKARLVEPKIFPGTSEHMKDLLLRLLKRAQKDRIGFDDFFNHPFLRTKVQSTSSTSPLPVPARTSSSTSDSPDGPMSISPVTSSIPISSPEDPIVIDPQGKFPSPEDSPTRSPLLKTIVERRELGASGSGMFESVEDDFVLVSTTLSSRSPSQQQKTVQGKAFKGSTQLSSAQSKASASPPLPAHFVAPLGTGDQGQDSSPSPNGRPSSLPLGSDSQSPPLGHQQRSSKASNKGGQSTALVLHRTSPQAIQMRTKVPSPTPGTTPSHLPYSSSLPTGGILHRISQHHVTSSPGRGSPSSADSDSPKPWVIKTPPQPPRMYTGSTPPRLTTSPSRRKISSPARLTSPPSLPAILASPAQGEDEDTSPSEPMSLPFANMSRRARTSSDLTDDSYNSPKDSIPFRRSASFSRLDQNALRAAFDSLPKTPSASLEGIPGACLANTPPTFPPFFIGAPSHSQSRRSSQYGDGSPSSQGSITFAASPPNMEGPITFEAPELIEETIMKPEHNETVERLHIMHSIVKAIVELAQSRNDPLAESVYFKDVTGTNTASHLCFVSENQRRAEQIVLYARAMELLTAALKLAKEELANNKLMNSKAVRNVISELHNQYKDCFQQCKILQLKKIEFSKDVDKLSVEIAADRLMYSHALDLCQSTGFEEMCGNPEECIGRYHSAQMLLHGLCLQAREEKDRDQLLKFKNILDQRLLFLEKQIHATTFLPFST